VTDPTRLVVNGATDFERSLLVAAARERPSSAQFRRMRRAIVLWSVGVLALSMKASAGTLGMILLSAVAAGVAPTSSSLHAPAPGTQEPSPVTPAVRSRSLPIGPVATDRGLGVVGDTETSASTARPKVALRHGRTSSLPESAPPSTAHDLKAEIELLDQARAAIHAGSPGQALSLLALYRGRHPHGALRQEADVVRIQALARSGNFDAAKSLARAFIAKHPNSPHVLRLRRLLSTKEEPH